MKKFTLLIAALIATVNYSFAGNQVLSAEGGRFVFGQINEYAKGQFMLDTKTGSLWRIVKDDDNSTLLEPINYIQYTEDPNVVKYTTLPITYTKGLK